MKISNIALEIIELLLNEGKECYLREIARKTDNSTSSISRQLNLLKSNKIITERKSGKELMYSLNFKNNFALKLCELIEIQKLEKFYEKNAEIKIILQDFLDKIKDENTTNVTIFGSIAKGKYTKESDIDILIISNEKRDFVKEIREINAEYGREISVVNLAKKELKKSRSSVLGVRNHLS